MIVNGDRVRDILSGFTGIVICEAKWMYGCRRLTVQPESLDNGKIAESASFDEPQLELLEKAALAPHRNVAEKRDTGGPRPEPVRREDPRR